MIDVLDKATQDVAARKELKGTKLTPTGMEKVTTEVKADMFNGRMPDMPTVFMPQEAIEAAVREIRQQAKRLLEVCAAIDASLGKDPIGEPTREEVAARIKAAEQAADLKAVEAAKAAVVPFAEDYAAKSEAAQAAAFTQPKVVPAPSGWVCPEHGSEALIPTESRKGRKYLSCGKCDEFQP